MLVTDFLFEFLYFCKSFLAVSFFDRIFGLDFRDYGIFSVKKAIGTELMKDFRLSSSTKVFCNIFESTKLGYIYWFEYTGLIHSSTGKFANKEFLY